jgi:hypothetical protein
MLRLHAAVFSLSILLSFAGCANNPNPRVDGSSGIDGSSPDGGVASGPCGGAGASCCVGRICELGLTCGRGDVCRIEPGSSTLCDSASDCDLGLACEAERCCAPRTAACSASSDCCTGLLCSEGTCQTATDIDPTMPDCGTPGGVCCAGFTCRDEGVCDNTTGRCEACGQAGQRCCDGATPCTSASLSCELMRDAGGVVSTQCVDPMDPSRRCGDVDQPCCDGATGMPTDCSGGLTCVTSAGGSMCLTPTDTGMMGEPCGPRDTCNAGLVCDRRTTPSGVCEMAPDDCGMNGMMCCDLGGSERACTGGLHCQFNECSMCRGPSLTCLLGGLLPGEQCCAGSTCRPAPLIPRCCMGDGGSCENSLDCCGLMQCNDGMCSCSREGSFCLDSSECCDGFVCDFFQCRMETAETMCKEGREACTSGSECCSGLACSETRTEPTAPPVRQCCSGGGTSCTTHEDCCGQMNCEDGECQCVTETGLCDRDIECCNGEGGPMLACITGSCEVAEGCQRETQTCDPLVLGSCCAQLRCDTSRRESASRCCADQGNRCRSSSECCGGMQCMNEECQCIAQGQTCDGMATICCEGLSCLESSAGARDWTCRTPP